ncbi:E3 ubiquitin-protein ligase TRIM11-like [Sardina pilchardus]|uniref:E3 ubiquitin-protein ligase TRIM11-like n=1 Tax=Sardina pilchardus TaxID=27697 RepID=UPI002E0DF1A8
MRKIPPPPDSKQAFMVIMKYWFSVTGLLSTNKPVVRRDPRKQKGTELRLIPRVSLGPRVVIDTSHTSDDGSTPTSVKYWFSVTGLLSTDMTVVRRVPRKQKPTELRLIPLVSLGPRVELDMYHKAKTKCIKAVARAESETELKILTGSQLLYEGLEELTVEELERFRLCVIEGILEVFVPIPEELLPNECVGVAERLMEIYGIEGSLTVTVNILYAMNCDDLANRLRTSVDRLQTHPKSEYPMMDICIVKGADDDWMTGDVAPYTCILTLDSQTAHRNLSLSGGDTKATFLSKKQSCPEHPERFDLWPQVMCKEGVSYGRYCWEVRWGGYAAIGVAYKSIGRKGRGDDCGLGFTKKSWCLLCEVKKYSAWHDANPIALAEEPSTSRRIRVCLDWYAGTLTFYKVAQDALIHLHTFHAAFSEPLHPMFRFYYFGQFGSSVTLGMPGLAM